MWEAFEHAGFNGLDNLTAIIDVNRLGQTRETMVGWDLDAYAKRAEAFGWHAIEIDGHDVDAIDAAYAAARADDRQADRDRRPHEEGQGRQGGRGPARQARQAARRPRGGDRGAGRRARPARSRSPSPTTAASRTCSTAPAASCRRWELGERGRHPQGLRRGARRARRPARRRRRARRRGVELDPLRGRSARRIPDRYFEMFIAEQQLVAAAVGMQVRGWTPFASTFAAFLSRAYDFVRMAAISRANLRLSGSHAGVSIGEDGPSQMALEDIASFRAVHGSDRAPPVRRQPDRAARGRDGRPRRHLVPAHAARRRRRCARRRTRTFEIGGSRVARRRRRRRDRGLRDHRRRGGRGRRARSSGEGINARVHRLLLDQADRRRDAARRGAASAARSSPSRTTGPRAASATPCSTRWPTATTVRRWSSSRCARCRARARPRSCCTPPGSTPTRSPAAAKRCAAANGSGWSA